MMQMMMIMIYDVDDSDDYYVHDDDYVNEDDNAN